MFKVKISIFFLLLGSSIAINAFAQSTNEECPYLIEPNFNIFIRGYKDTIQTNGMKARKIEAGTLTKGFELLTSDTLVRLRSFQLVFEASDGHLYSRVANGARISTEEDDYVFFQKISTAVLIAIDKIIVEYKGNCYLIPGQVYHIN